jgi:peptide/nickel transport system permease protein
VARAIGVGTPTKVREAGTDGARLERGVTSQTRLQIPLPIVACGAVLLVLALAAIFAGPIAPHDPTAQSLLDRNRPPVWLAGGSPSYPLGSDNLGYDIFSRLIFGARVSLGIGLIGSVIGLCVGAGLGLIAGYFRGAPDWLVMLLVDAHLATPYIIIAIAAIAAFGKGIPILIVLAGTSGWPLFARACRSSVLSLREREFVVAARATGATSWWILFRHVLPNIASLILVLVTIDLRRVILFESSLSFLGLGIQPPQASWGSMINQGREYLNTAWWIGVFPGIALMLTILSVSLIGDWLRDKLQPSLRNS